MRIGGNGPRNGWKTTSTISTGEDESGEIGKSYRRIDRRRYRIGGFLMNDLEKFISETRDEKNPMDNWTRVIIETEEKNPKPIAVITNDNFELAKGFRIRLLPSEN